ncbi:MAG: glycosyltransferase family 4 protein [Candidatus Omnitrophota bacterium]
MNILILCTHFNPAGISRYTLNLAKGLKERGHRVWVGSSGGEWLPKLTQSNITHIYLPIKTKSICSLKIPLSLNALLSFVAREQIQIIHANTRVTQYLAYLTYKLRKIPYISTFHGFHQPTVWRRHFKLAGLRTIAVSEAVKKHLHQDMHIDESKIRMIHNGIDEKEFTVRRKSKIDYGFKETDFVIGILGRISEEKGHFIAAEALKLLSFNHPNVYLAVSGKGRLLRQLKLFFKLADLEQRVKFFDMDSKDFLDIPDILVVPSKREGFGYAIVEAFAKGVPVVGFNTGGIAEIIRNGENGVLFYHHDGSSLQEAIEGILSHRNLCTQLVENAREDVSLFSLARMATATENVYKELIR